MVRIQRQDFRKVLNGDVSLFQFVIRTSHDVQRTDIEFVQLEKCIAVLNGFFVKLDFEIAACTDEECFSMEWVLRKLVGAYLDEVVEVHCIYSI